MSSDEDLEEHRSHHRAAKPEPSTFLRMTSILAQRIEGDFTLEYEKLIINTHHMWIAEGKTQEEMHARYVTATIYILGSVVRKIEDRRFEKGPADRLVRMYDDLSREMNTCGVVSVSSTHDESGDGEEFTLDTYASIKDPSKKEENNTATLTPMTKSKIECLPDQFEIAFHEARENGFMRVNCGAREHYQAALLLWKQLNDDNGKMEIKGDVARASDYDGGLRR